MMKDNLRSEYGETYEIMRFNCVKSKIQKKNQKLKKEKNYYFFWYNIEGKNY